MSRADVAVISMGGTISCAPSDDGDLGGLVPTTEPTQGLALEGVRLTPIAWSLTDSAEITFEEIVHLAHEVRARFAAGADGIVVTQGTDTLEETTYALSLLRPADRPVVFTGAMRAPTLPGSDADSNLVAAIRTAVHPDLPRVTSGAVLVMNDQIHAATWVRKAHTQRLDAFSSGAHADLGQVSEGQVRFARQEAPSAVPALLDSDTGTHVKVAMLTAVLDHDPDLIRSVASLGYDGLVVEGMGGGHVSGTVADALEEVAASMPVVFASRAREGAVMTRTYGSPGAELDLIAKGCIPSGHLTGLKARVLLTLLLRSGYERDRVEELILAAGGVRADLGAYVSPT